MSPRSVSALTVLSLAALAVAGCNPRLAPSHDAPNPTIGGPPLRVDLVHPGDQPDGPPIPPADAPVEIVEDAGEPASAPVSGPTPEVAVTPVAQTPADPQPQEAPRLTPVAQVEPASHCRAAEETLYNCPFQDGRVLSVCMGDQIAYRFGRPGAAELDLGRDPAAGGVSYDLEQRPGDGQQTRLRFQNGAYDYVVYSSQSEDRDEAGGARSSGVVVRRGGREIARIQCPNASAQTLIPVAMIRDTVRRDDRGERRRRS